MKTQEICVHSTLNYTQFKTLKGNRTVNPSNVKAIVKSMEEEQLIVPAIVNEFNEVIDGQHRLQACAELKKPFYYIQMAGYGLTQVQRMNSHMKNWGLNDYLDSFIDRYNNGEHQFINYVLLKEFIQETDITAIASVLVIAYNGSASDYNKTLFKAGEFKFFSLTKSQELAHMAKDFQQFFPLVWNRAGFLKTFIALTRLEGYNHDYTVGNLPTQWVSYKETSGVEGWRNALIDIHNFKRPRNKKLNVTELKYLMEDILNGKV